MFTYEDIVLRKDRNVILKRECKRGIRYYTGVFDQSYRRIQNISNTTKEHYLECQKIWC